MAAIIGFTQDSPSGGVTYKDGKASAKFRVEYLVLADNLNQDQVYVCSSTNISGLPDYGASYSFLGNTHTAVVVDKSAKRKYENSAIWIVTVSYESQEIEEDEFENPLLEAPKISFTFQKDKEIVYAEVDEETGVENGGIRNSAGALIKPPPLREVSRPILTITRNESIATDIAAVAMAFIDRVNDAEFWGVAAGKARIVGISPKVEEREIDSDGTKLRFLVVTYTIAFRPANPNGWKLKLLDYGDYYLDNDNNEVKFIDELGHPLKDQLLNGAGKPSDVETFLDPITIYEAADFDALGLPEEFS